MIQDCVSHACWLAAWLAGCWLAKPGWGPGPPPAGGGGGCGAEAGGGLGALGWLPAMNIPKNEVMPLIK